MQSPKWLKLTLSGLFALIVLVGLILPVAALIGGTEVNISSFGGGGPDIDISGNGQFIAVTYFKQENGSGAVYIKSSTAAQGWLTSRLVGFGSNPQLAFNTTSNNIVYVVWANASNKAIQAARCTLSPTTAPNCVLGTDVQTSTTATLNFPDIVVDNTGRVHVVWENNSTIQSRFANNVNLSSWSNPVATVTGGGDDKKPALAWSSGGGGRLHLAFLRGNPATRIEYRRSDDASHSWVNPLFFQQGTLLPSHDRFDNPTIAAKDSNVFIAWDAHRTSGASHYSLAQATSTDDGDSFGNPTYAPSGGLATINQGSELKVSLSSVETPGQESALRPSLTISGTNAALVWQQIDGECFDPTPATIHFASPIIGAGFDTLTSNGDDDYMIDPDVAVFTSTRHFVYMRDVDAACPGGLILDYLITYRGPFTKTTNDVGEGDVYLPIIVKNKIS